jgi:GNAT superfamily N-acetyltransferase
MIMNNLQLAEIISNITKNEPNLMYRTKDEILSSLNSNSITIKYDNKDNLQGFIINKKLKQGFTEIGSLYVLPEYRKNGIGKELLYEAISKFDHNKIIVRTKDKSLKQILKSKDFTPVSLKYNWTISFVYLWDRIKNPYRFFNFLKTVGKKSCVFIKINK